MLYNIAIFLYNMRGSILQNSREEKAPDLAVARRSCEIQIQTPLHFQTSKNPITLTYTFCPLILTSSPI